jgi:hypothetical protein
MPYPTDQPPTTPHQMPSGGLLFRAFQQAQPSIPPEQWLTNERPAIPIQSRLTASQPARHREGSHVSTVNQDGSSLSQVSTLRSRSNRWIRLGVVLAIILAGIWGVSLLPLSTLFTSTLHSTPVPQTSASTVPQSGTPGTSSAASPTPSALAITDIQQITATFLAAYFTWSASDSDEAYTSHWRPFVADAAARDLIQAAPRSTLDAGNDGAATSQPPAIPPSAVQIGNQQALVQMAWTIQVLPAGGELIQWQTRRVQATLSLIKNASSWQITQASWTSTSG